MNTVASHAIGESSGMRPSSKSSRWPLVWRRIASFAVLATVLGSQDGFAQYPLPLGLPPVPIPTDNPQTPEKIALGKALFMDKRLSADGSVSCATCHRRDRAFSDGLVTAEGIGKQQGVRNAPSIVRTRHTTLRSSGTAGDRAWKRRRRIRW